MSHSKERKEKICLNCNAEVYGLYCHVCGQENVDPKETFWSLVTHFFYDITHFHGKFFTTLRSLVARPGQLPRDYIEGRRARYLHPIRMYVFTSALFFIVFYSVVNVRDWDFSSRSEKRLEERAKQRIDSARQVALQYAKTKDDSAVLIAGFRLMESARIPPNAVEDSAAGYSNIVNMSFSKRKYRNRIEYDSIQKILPPAERDGWLRKRLMYRSLEINSKYAGNQREFAQDLVDRFLHTFPYLLFVSLPLYAVFLKLLYIRRKQYFYVDHGIFLIYLYIFTFIVLLLLFGLSRLNDVPGFGWIWIPEAMLVLFGIWYTLKAMKNFYNQGWGKTFLKFILFNFLCQFVLVFLFIFFLAITVLRF